MTLRHRLPDDAPFGPPKTRRRPLWLATLFASHAAGALRESVAASLIARAQRDPYSHLPGYMERYWLLRPRRKGGMAPIGEWGVRIHRILRSDADRHLHDHPWSCISVVLRGGYWEVMPKDPEQPASDDRRHHIVEWRGPGAIVSRRAEDRHRLILPEGRDCWSLFIVGRKDREWGFHDPCAPNSWVHWREYVDEIAEEKT